MQISNPNYIFSCNTNVSDYLQSVKFSPNMSVSPKVGPQCFAMMFCFLSTLRIYNVECRSFGFVGSPSLVLFVSVGHVPSCKPRWAQRPALKVIRYRHPVIVVGHLNNL